MQVTAPDNSTPAVLTARARILALQEACRALDDAHRMDASPPVNHWLAPGVYVREIALPADSVVVGRIHRFEHLSIITRGRVTVFTEHGKRSYAAGDVFLAPAGTKRVVWTHEDATWLTVHPNPDDLADAAQLEQRFTAAEYAELSMIAGDLPELTL